MEQLNRRIVSEAIRLLKPGEWVWSLEHRQLCRIVETQTLWGETTCRVSLSGKDTVGRLPATRLRPVHEATVGTVDGIAYLAAAARKIPENILQEDPKLLMWYDQAVTRLGDAETRGMTRNIRSYKDLRVYKNAMDAAMRIFKVTKAFPPEEKYSMVDQMRRSSRSVCANLAEAWRKRRYKAAFVAKLSDAEGEACETQVWLEFAQRCGYLEWDLANELDQCYDKIIGQLVTMIGDADKWLIR